MGKPKKMSLRYVTMTDGRAEVNPGGSYSKPGIPQQFERIEPLSAVQPLRYIPHMEQHAEFIAGLPGPRTREGVPVGPGMPPFVPNPALGAVFDPSLQPYHGWQPTESALGY